MVNISEETPEQTDAHLSCVIKEATLKVYDHPYAFLEFGVDRFPSAVRADALALVRDDSSWSQLVPCADDSEERFTIFRFHFKKDVDNSGFVGWLATHLKRQFGTGVFVTCGQNRHAGGIYDYWGVPTSLGEPIVSEIRGMMAARPTNRQPCPSP